MNQLRNQSQLSNKTSKLVREQVISEACEDLTDTEIEKFKSLTEDVDFANEESFKAKLDTLKESYFPKTIVEQTLMMKMVAPHRTLIRLAL
jgi:hypothetical protein